MKKTININLAGYVFSIDEDAYDRLDSYLDAVKDKLGPGEEAEETLDDINRRVAELFRGVNRDAKSPITIEDVEEIIKTLGDPTDYEQPSDPDEPHQEKEKSVPPPRKKLFRDPDNRFLGGVCGGLGNYFGTDPVLFRLLFIVATLFYGSSLLVYIVLWIAIPKAVTVQQRIMMMGSEPGNEAWRRRQATRYEGGDPMNGILRVVAIVAGIVMIIFTFVSLMGLIMAFSLTDLLLSTVITDGAWIQELGSFFLLPEQRLTAILGLLLTLGVPLLVLFYLGLHLVFRFKRGGSAFLIVSLILWLGGISLLTITGVGLAKDFTSRVETEERKELKMPASDTIYVQPSMSSLNLGEGQHIFSKDGVSIKKRDNELTLVGTPRFEVSKTSDSFKVTVNKKARGRNSQNALENANLIEYFYLQDDSILILDRYFSMQNVAMMRGQKVTVSIEIPESKELKVADEFRQLIDEPE